MKPIDKINILKIRKDKWTNDNEDNIKVKKITGQWNPWQRRESWRGNIITKNYPLNFCWSNFFCHFKKCQIWEQKGKQFIYKVKVEDYIWHHLQGLLGGN